MRASKGGTARIATYLRCSHDDSAQGDFTTIDVQRQITARYIEEAGGTFAGEYVDEGRTGTNLNRPGWKQLLADARAHKFDKVCISYMSRLGRGNPFVIAEYELNNAGVRVEMVREQFSEDLYGYMNKQMTVMLDGMYAKQVSQWTKTKQAGMVEAGYWTGGRAPFGYRSETVPGTAPVTGKDGKTKPPPKRLVPFPDESSLVRRAYELYRLTRNMGEVLRLLRSDPVSSGQSWDMDKVRRLLTNDAYRGVLRYGQNVNQTAHEAIVGEEVWDAVQSALQEREEARQDAPASAAFNRPSAYNVAERVDCLPYYLRGLVFCPHCLSRMTPTGAHGMTRKIGYYVCVKGGNRSKSDHACPVQRVNAGRLHGAVLEEIERLSQHPTRLDGFLREAVRGLPSPASATEDLSRTLRNKREAEKRIARLVEAIKSGGADLRSLNQEIREQEALYDKLTRDMDDIQKRILMSKAKRPDTDALRALWASFRANWEYLTEDERTELLPLIVEKVVMEDKERGILHLILQNPPREGGNSLLVWVRESPEFPPANLRIPLRIALSERSSVNPPTCQVPFTVLRYRRKRARRISCSKEGTAK